jgi:hypothetical protein
MEPLEADMEPAPTQEKAKAISGLSADTAHKICSDRVTKRNIYLAAAKSFP